MKTPEYKEGLKARESFERGMKPLFQVSKDGYTPRHKNQEKRANKTNESGPSRDAGGEA